MATQIQHPLTEEGLGVSTCCISEYGDTIMCSQNAIQITTREKNLKKCNIWKNRFSRPARTILKVDLH